MKFEDIIINNHYTLCRNCGTQFPAGSIVKILAKGEETYNYNIAIECNDSREWVNNSWLERPLKVKTVNDFHEGEVVRVSYDNDRWPGSLAVITNICKSLPKIRVVLPMENNKELVLHPCELIKIIQIDYNDMKYLIEAQEQKKMDLKRTINSIYGVNYCNEYGIKSIQIFEDTKIVTTIFKDNKAIVIKCSENDDFDPYIGVALAIAQHIYGSKNKFRKYVDRMSKVVKEKK